MSEYRCSQCKTEYTFTEYQKLDRQPLNPEDKDPMKGSGYEAVCECGAAFHSDKWSLRETIDTDHGEVTVSTVALNIPHGPSHSHWYETCVFHDSGSEVVERYHTQDGAERGHEKYVKSTRNAEFQLQPTGQRMEYTHD